MKIGIIYIATGSYIEFFEGYYDSAEKNFIPGSSKTYFVFTDGNHPYFDKPNVVCIPQHQEYWPYAVLHKFHYILQINHLLENLDFIFLTNANLKFITQIHSEEILPTTNESSLVGVEGPWMYNPRKKFNLETIFDKHQEFESYVPKKFRKLYFASGFVGGKTPEFLVMSFRIRNMIEKDLAKGHIPVWHDQDYVNKYFLVEKHGQIKILHSGFLYPSEYQIPFEKRILQLPKKRNGDFLMAYYRKYHWSEGKKHNTKFGKIKSYFIHQTIKALKKLDK